MNKKLIPKNTEKLDKTEYVLLHTYYPGYGDYPLTGHSEIIIEDPESEFNYDYISKWFGSKNYNLITNNCSDATREALEYTFNKKMNHLLFTTPGDVQDFAKKLGAIPAFKKDSIYNTKLQKYIYDKDYKNHKRLERDSHRKTLVIPLTQKQKTTMLDFFRPKKQNNEYQPLENNK